MKLFLEKSIMKQINDISCVELDVTHLEMLRVWRNHPTNRHQHEYQEELSAQAQQNWFKQLDKEKQFFQLFAKQTKWLGMSHLSNMNKEIGSAEVGILLNPEYLQTGVSFAISFYTLERAFKELKLKILYAKLKKENNMAIKYNETLGFRFLKEAPNPDFVIYQLSEEAYEFSKSNWMSLITHL